MDYIRRDTARHYRHVRRILQSGRSEPQLDCPRASLRDKVLFIIFILAAVILGSWSVVHSADITDGLSPELKKAYYELKKAGFDVKVKTFKKGEIE